MVRALYKRGIFWYTYGSMHDIKIPDPSGKKAGFDTMHVTPMSPQEVKAPEPGDKVKVKFEKFVQLVATHDFEGVMKAHAQEDIIVNTNLLTDLANAHEEEPHEGKKLPIIFIVGIIIGVVLTYLMIRY